MASASPNPESLGRSGEFYYVCKLTLTLFVLPCSLAKELVGLVCVCVCVCALACLRINASQGMLG